MAAGWLNQSNRQPFLRTDTNETIAQYYNYSSSKGGDTMWMLVPAISLAIVQIAGDNVAVVPDIALVIGNGIYSTVIVAYILLGSIVTGLSAWIGVRTGLNLVQVMKKMYGTTGKVMLAFIVLAVSLPASAITGGYFAGLVLQELTGMPQIISAACCLVVCALLAAESGRDWLQLSNYCSLLLLPMLFIMVWHNGFSFPAIHSPDESISWPLIFALIGYHAGGIRLVLIVETAALLTKKAANAIVLTMGAKVLEGLITVGLAQLVVGSGLYGPLTLSQIADASWGQTGAYLFNIILLCTFINTMAPAMMVNAKQISVISRLPLLPATAAAVIIIYLLSLVSLCTLLAIMSVTGLLTVLFLLCVTWMIHQGQVNN